MGPVAITEEALLANARALKAAVAAASDRIDAERALPPELVEAFHDAGIFRMAIPKVYGGIDASPVTCARVVEEIAAADGSAGWCAMINWQNTSLCASLPEAGASAVFANQRGAYCGTARQTGKAFPAEGGFRISGRWPFASGSNHATWFGAECMVMHGDEPERDAGGGTIGRMFLVPREQVTVHDTWQVTGLRGTGSNDFTVDDVFVPAERSFRILVDAPPATSVRAKAVCLEFLGHGTHSLGVAQGALDAARELAPVKVVYGGQTMAESDRFQADFARAQALVESARGYLYGTAEGVWERLLAGREPSDEERARVRVATSLAAANSLEAVDLLHRGMGTSVLFQSSPLERRFRDIHAAGAHVMIGIHTWEAGGRVFLGRPAEFPFF